MDEETKKKLETKEDLKVPDLVKNWVQIRNTNDYNEISEKILQKLVLEDIPSFLKELGNGFCFIDNEYKIKLGDRYNYHQCRKTTIMPIIIFVVEILMRLILL